MRRSGPGVAAAGIGLSRFSGVARSVLVTNILGIGLIGDAFAAAQRVPNILQNLFGEGALSAAFVPEYSRLLESDPKEAGKLAGGILSFLLCLVAGLTAVAAAVAINLVTGFLAIFLTTLLIALKILPKKKCCGL